MKTHFLLPRALKKIGWLLFLPGLITAIVLRVVEYDFHDHAVVRVFSVIGDEIFSDAKYFSMISNGIIDEILLVMIIVGGIMVGFAKHRNEDELIANIRYESLVWAFYVNFGVMLLATVFVYGTAFFDVMVANMFTMLFFFIVRFHLMLYKLNKSAEDEE